MEKLNLKVIATVIEQKNTNSLNRLFSDISKQVLEERPLKITKR